MRNRWTLPAILAGMLATGPAMAQQRWPEANWNPKPLPDDLVLPLPCNGAIAFRPIATPVTSGDLADRAAMMGQSNPESDYKEYLRQTYLLGPFRGADASKPPVYYLAKYEVTKDQYAAVMEAPCPSGPTTAGSIPQTGVPWHQAVNFTVRLTGWLMQNARDALPKQGGATAFMRLPTEDEWEYAARGGSAVSEADFGGRIFPLDGDLNRYVWFQGSRSAQGRVNIIGRREPNPLGLFDILGNVSEWVLDPYRLNKVGRPHGLAGGQVVRGGDYRTDEGQIRTSLREEIPPFSPSGEPSASPSIGFRPSLAMVVEFNDQRPLALREAFQKEVDVQGAAANDPRKLLEKLRQDASEPALKEGITRIEGALNAETRAKKDQESRTIQAQIEAAGFIGRQIAVGNSLGTNMARIAQIQQELLTTESSVIGDLSNLANVSPDQLKQAMRKMADRLRVQGPVIQLVHDTTSGFAQSVPGRLNELGTVYMGVVLSAGRTADRARIGNEGAAVLQALSTRPQQPQLLKEMIEVAIRHMEEASAGRVLPADQAVQQIIARAAAATARPPQGAPAQGGPPARR